MLALQLVQITRQWYSKCVNQAKPQMKKLLAMILQEPERFTRYDLPCSLWAIWEMTIETARGGPSGRPG
jgi:hypothetical protein